MTLYQVSISDRFIYLIENVRSFKTVNRRYNLKMEKGLYLIKIHFVLSSFKCKFDR